MFSKLQKPMHRRDDDAPSRKPAPNPSLKIVGKVAEAARWWQAARNGAGPVPLFPTQSLLNLPPPSLPSRLHSKPKPRLLDWNRHGESRLHKRRSNPLEKAVPDDAPPITTHCPFQETRASPLPDWRRPDPILNSPRLEVPARRRCGPRCALRPSRGCGRRGS